MSQKLGKEWQWKVSRSEGQKRGWSEMEGNSVPFLGESGGVLWILLLPDLVLG